MKDILAKAIEKMPKYKPYSLSQLIVEKVFNDGMGAIPIFRFYPDEKKIAVNEWCCNKTDLKHLNTLREAVGAEDYEIISCLYGYPEFYNHDFGLKYAINKQ